MSYYETRGDLHDDWCGVTLHEQAAVSAALEGREDDLLKMSVWQLEECAAALAHCRRENCRTHDSRDARDLVERVITQLES